MLANGSKGMVLAVQPHVTPLAACFYPTALALALQALETLPNCTNLAVSHTKSCP